MPRKPARLNDVSQRFEVIKRHHQLMNSALEDHTVKKPIASLTMGAINLNEEVDTSDPFGGKTS
jgi:hypothetical protein